ncbi:MAG: glycosyltransferase family 2 protein [Acutalibacteraceae bacterium]
MISIVVPAYNCSGFIARCVDSLRVQSYSDLQIILVDDGSSDDTPSVCDALAAADSRITVLHKSNGGVSSARNAGISAAEGEYITFVDADDYVNPDHLENLYSLMQKHACDVAICSYSVENESACKPARPGACSCNEVCYDHDSAVCELLAGGAVGGYVWNKLYRRELLEGVEFDGGIKILEDLLFNYNVFKRVKSAVFSDCSSYHYIQRGQSAMHRGFDEEHRQMVQTARFICRDLSDESRELVDAGKGLLATTILWVVDVMAEYGPYDAALVKEYRAEFKPLKKTYMRLRRVPFSYRASAVFFSMGYPVFKLSVKTVRKLKGQQR